jgi:hypothetical protein
LKYYFTQKKYIDMKNMLFLTVLFALCTNQNTYAQNYAVGDGLVVAANSGLRLRIHPNKTAPTIKVLEYNDPVIVQSTNDFDGEYADRIQWFDGYWVKVKSGLVSGWVFDGFLTTMKLPTHEDQLCIDCDNIVVPLQQYIKDNYPSECGEELAVSGEDVAQYTTVYEDGIETAIAKGEGWYRAEFVFDGRRISEVLNLVRAMLVGKRAQSDFEDSLVFHEDRYGYLEKIEINYFDYPVTIEESPDGFILLSSTIIDLEPGASELVNH